MSRNTHRVAAAIVTATIAALLGGCASGDSIDEEARDACEDEFGVGNCVERREEWVPLASATSSTTDPTQATTTSTSTTAPSTTAPPTTLPPTTLPATHDLTGSVEFDQRATRVNPAGGWTLEPCEGINGYDDMHVGAPVVVTNAGGTVIATTQIASGEWFDVDRQSDGWEFGACRLHFSLAGVPDSDFYGVQIGRRDPYPISKGDLEAQGWNLQLFL